jgi:protein TonB
LLLVKEVLLYLSAMKLRVLTIALTLFTGLTFAQEVPNLPEQQKDSATLALEKTNPAVFVEQVPTFPGGDNAFMTYIGRHINKPELVALFGFKGRIVVGFTVGRSGLVKDVKAFSAGGLGYEDEVVSAISHSPAWKPGIQNGTPVDVKYTIPFTIDLPRAEIDMLDLKRSNYKFTFQIKDKTYDIKQAEAILGNKFSNAIIDYIKTFLEQPEENKKQKAYLIQIKD